MSQEHMTRLTGALTSDSALQSRLQEAKSLDEVVSVANQLGYDITLQDLKPEAQISGEGALSDAELEGVSGGLNKGSVATNLDGQGSQTQQGRDRKKSGMDNIQKLLDLVRGMNPQL